jgi:DNA invertase Pin-like site-specific DNA recombinase
VWIFEPAIDTTSPLGRALDGIMAVCAELRVDTIRQNTRRARARQSPGLIRGRPTVMTPDKLSEAIDMRAEVKTIAYVAGVLNVGEATVKRALKVERERGQLQEPA